MLFILISKYEFNTVVFTEVAVTVTVCGTVSFIKLVNDHATRGRLHNRINTNLLLYK